MYICVSLSNLTILGRFGVFLRSPASGVMGSSFVCIKTAGPPNASKSKRQIKEGRGNHDLSQFWDFVCLRFAILYLLTVEKKKRSASLLQTAAIFCFDFTMLSCKLWSTAEP